MNYYLINRIPHAHPEYCFFDRAPLGTGAFDYRMAKGMPVADRYPADARAEMTDEYPGFQLPDFIGNTKGLLMVSRRMKDVIENMVQWEIEYLPFSVYDHKKRLVSKDYFIVNPIDAYDCLNLERCTIVYSKSTPGAIVDIEKFVLDRKKLETAPHLFRIKEAPREYVMSQALALEFKKQQFTNVYSWELEQA